MTWKSLFRFERKINIPELDIVLACPYFFVRLMWVTTSKEFRAWPNTLDSGVVIGWRWPLKRRFAERQWLKKQQMPLAIYGLPMDTAYLARAAQAIGLTLDQVRDFELVRHIGITVKEILHAGSGCGHHYWIASCPNCARKALLQAVEMKKKYEPLTPINLNEPPYTAFLRREEEARETRSRPMKKVRQRTILKAHGRHWTPYERVVITDDMRTKHPHLLHCHSIYYNSRYECQLFACASPIGGVMQVNIRRHGDVAAVTQEDIKRTIFELFGPEAFAVEVYPPPAADTKFNPAIRTLWILPATWELPFGLHTKTAWGRPE